MVTIVDYNKIQSFGRVADVLGLEPFCDKWQAFGWRVEEIDSHDHSAIRAAIATVGPDDRPTAVIAHTVKGKGVAFMEDDFLWHDRPPSDQQLAEAVLAMETRP